MSAGVNQLMTEIRNLTDAEIHWNQFQHVGKLIYMNWPKSRTMQRSYYTTYEENVSPMTTMQD